MHDVRAWLLFRDPFRWGRHLFRSWLLAELRVEGYSFIFGFALFVAGFALDSDDRRETRAETAD